MTTVLLASASPARLAVLRAAGLEPRVAVSGVDEDAVLAGLSHAEPADRIRVLAEAKADAVAASVIAGTTLDIDAGDVLVIGCDSMLLIDGELQGKPENAEQAKQRWRQMAGRDGVLISGHAVRRVTAGRVAASASAARSTTVRMGRPTDAELDAYIATGEPLAVAGALTIDGLGGWFVEGVDGDPSNVLGLSLPLTRELLQHVGVRVTDLWQVPRRAGDRATSPGPAAPNSLTPRGDGPAATAPVGGGPVNGGPALVAAPGSAVRFPRVPTAPISAAPISAAPISAAPISAAPISAPPISTPPICAAPAAATATAAPLPAAAGHHGAVRSAPTGTVLDSPTRRST